jgi:prepilin-type N-terminal cleavage/methylation domain-containing protein
MNSKRGFTLVELLVVLAIISILATIVVPNVAEYLRKAQATRAVSEINSMETAFTKMVGDANRTELSQLLNPAGVAPVLLNAYLTDGSGAPTSGTAVPETAAQFRTATQVYTNIYYALLRDGRGLLDGSANDPQYNFQYRSVIDQNAARRLGIGYLDIGFDPWENLYQIWPGPWPSRVQPIPFRTFAQPGADNLPGRQSGGDLLTTNYVDPDTGDSFQAGFPAPRNKPVFIWSFGANTVTGQALYSASGYPAPPATNYDQNQDPEFIAGGDDINNWDPARTWERFYN